MGQMDYLTAAPICGHVSHMDTTNLTPPTDYVARVRMAAMSRSRTVYAWNKCGHWISSVRPPAAGPYVAFLPSGAVRPIVAATV